MITSQHTEVEQVTPIRRDYDALEILCLALRHRYRLASVAVAAAVVAALLTFILPNHEAEGIYEVGTIPLIGTIAQPREVVERITSRPFLERLVREVSPDLGELDPTDFTIQASAVDETNIIKFSVAGRGEEATGKVTQRLVATLNEEFEQVHRRSLQAMRTKLERLRAEIARLDPATPLPTEQIELLRAPEAADQSEPSSATHPAIQDQRLRHLELAIQLIDSEQRRSGLLDDVSLRPLPIALRAAKFGIIGGIAGLIIALAWLWLQDFQARNRQRLG